MGQVTSRVSDEVEAALNRWSTDVGIQRSDLIRQILGEAVDARREGRAMFQRPTAPSAADLSRLAATMETASTEFERVLRQQVKSEKQLGDILSTFSAGEEQTKKRLLDEMVEKVRTAFNPGSKTLASVREAMTDLPDRVGDHPRIVALGERLERVEKLAGELRPNVYHQLNGVDLSWPRIAGVSLLAFLVSVGLFFGLAALFPQRLALPTANRLLGGGDQAVCALVNYRMGIQNCRTTIDGSEMRVRVNADRQPDKKR